ncbi:unnamed protein product [Acanthoscelides obtectus]|uniref:MADF domain-containing protein n=1 Tax=Acanthoscelides obtectus TaxID=200917 RepID=A0A9P0LBX0_ACAOB|nr:unnamed protein product [Acanthoscelides obtectus]CAK1667884.1 hypothetical protein AOBTE_LOCUS26088 [Acanthoscelides obtectus]
MTKVERDATIDNVKKKINSLRAGYRKEFRKVRDSMRTGSGTDQVNNNKNDTEITNHNLSNPATPSTSNASSTRRTRQANEEIAKTISLIGEKLEKPEDEYDAIGKNIAAKLRNMTPTQQGIAEK